MTNDGEESVTEPTPNLVGKPVILKEEQTGKKGIVIGQLNTDSGHPYVTVQFPDGSIHDCSAGEVEIVK
jgi:hypothetical protein